MDTEDFPRQLARTRRFTLGVPRAFTVSPDGRRVLFLRTRGGEDATSCLWVLDGDRETLLLAPEMLGSTGDVPEAERARRERAREQSSGVVAYATDTAVRTVVAAVDGHLWLVGDDSRPRHVPTQGPVVDPRVDPTGSRVAYVSDGALRVVSLEDGTDAVLAGPDGPDVVWGLAEHVAAESMHRTRGFWWSPDGTRLLAARVDTSAVQRWWVTDPAQPARPPRAIAYPAAGTANADVTLHALDVAGGSVEVSWDRDAFEYVTAAGWDAFGPLVAVQSRDPRTLQVVTVDPDTGSTALLHEQRDAAWVELVPGTPVRTGTGLLVHTADTEGARRLLVDGRPVTPEGLNVREVIDTTGDSVLFLASDEPTETHVWSWQPGGSLERLSAGPGLHTGVRRGGTVVLASHTEQGREVAVRRRDEADTGIASLDSEPVVAARVKWLRAGDLDIRTALVLPSWHHAGTPLPVLMAPYAGPAMQLVTRARHAARCEAQWFAESGFAVVVADGRGTPGRGPAWEKAVHGDTLTAPLEDQVTALHAAAEHCADLDLDRVAIRGWSYGGTLAAAAVLRMPDTFHAVVSGAAPSDQRLYDTHWRERFLGHPAERPEAYERSSPITDAHRLRRPLLLVHGVADDNVVVAHTLRMSAALLAAGRPHHVLPLSGATHVLGDEATAEGLLRHQLHFLREALGVRAHADLAQE